MKLTGIYKKSGFLLSFLVCLLITVGQAKADIDYTPIYDIQYTTDASGDSPYMDQVGVTTEGIVTAVFYNSYFIQDPSGGAWTGLYVYDSNIPAVGDRLRLTGTVTEYYGLTEMHNLTDGAVISSGNPLPAPEVLASGDVSQEMWEGVLVRVANVTVTDGDMGYGEWSVSDGSGDVVIDDRGSYTYVPATGDTLSAVTGPLDYSYGVFKIQPRDDNDIVPPLDYTPIYNIQYTTDPSGDSPYKDQVGVTTEGIVTMVFYNSYFIQDPAGGAWSGLFVYDSSAPAVGDRLRLTGTVVEYYGLTEMKDLTDGAVVSSGNALPAPVILASGDVPQEMWEGVLVRVENVTVTNGDMGFGEWSVSDGSGDVVIDDRGSYTYMPADGDTLAAVIGPLDYSFGAFKMQPRDNLDIISGPGDECPEDPNKTEPGVCGCGVPDTDSDADGLEDCIDLCPYDPADDNDGDTVCGDIDNCPEIPNPDQENNDGDSLGDACDTDDDNDGTPDAADACPYEDAANRDADGDGCSDTAEDLEQVVKALELHHGLEKSFLAKIRNIQNSINAGSTKEAINQLNALSSQIEAQTGKKLTMEEAAMLQEYIKNLLHALGADAKYVFCEALSPSSSGTVCDVTTGSPSLLIKGAVLGIDTVYQGGEVLVDETGLIVYVGCSDERPQELAGLATQATKIQCAEGVVSPGLINAHDHMYYNQNYPFPTTDERYDHRNDWRDGGPSAPGDFAPEKIMWSEIRQSMTGTTSIAGAGGDLGFLRNLDMGYYPFFDDLLWDIFIEPPTVIETDTFPLENPGDYLQNEGDCSEYPYLGADPSSYDVYAPHVAEGINAAAQNEFACLSSFDNNGTDIVDENFAMVHGIALNAYDGNSLAEDGGAVIWSPRSNISLYGNTAQVSMLKNQGVLIALSTDWTPSGSMNLGRELVCADTLNRKYFNTVFSDRELWLMATYNPAAALQVDDRIGSLKPGMFGDIAIYDGRGKQNPYRAVIEADAERTTLVLRRSSIPFSLFEGPNYIGSVALYGDVAVLEALPPTLHELYAGMELCEPLDVCGVDKSVCVLQENWWTEIAGWGTPFSFYGDLVPANTESYPLFFCEEPLDEPTCIPLRTGEYDGTIVLNTPDEDRDGDAILDPDDNCPEVFNPIRPMDEGVQADADDDGIGDACDTCPLDVDPGCTANVP